MEQQARADQPSTALQALQQQQQQSATTAQQAQRRAAAAQAAGAGASAVVDTRLLSKQMAFDGRETSWRSFKFHFVAYCGAIDSRLKDLLVLGETRVVAAMRNIHMDPDTRALSAQLYYTLIMVCPEGAQKLLEHAGDTEGGAAASAGRVRAEDRRTTVCFAARAPPLWIPWRPAYSLGRVRGATSQVLRAVW